MIMTGNTYFKSMYDTCCEWQKVQSAHEAVKEETIQKFGWDSEEVKAWYAREKEIKAEFPYSNGEMKAYWAYDRTETEEFELNDFCWEREVADFIGTLRKAGIQSFVYTNQSTAVMENIHEFIKEGCTLEGPCVLEKKSHRWGTEEVEQLLGLRFKIN